MKTSYRIVVQTVTGPSDHQAFLNAVNQALNDGWQLSGGVAAGARGEIMQAMVRNEDRTIESKRRRENLQTEAKV